MRCDIAERQHQDAEERKAWNGLDQAEPLQHDGAQLRHPEAKDAERQADDDGDRERAERQQQMGDRLGPELRRPASRIPS